MIGFKPLRPIVPTSAAVSWCEPSPVKSTVRRDGSARAIPSVAPVAHPIDPQRVWQCTSAPSGSHLMVDEYGIIWEGGRRVGPWGVNGNEEPLR